MPRKRKSGASTSRHPEMVIDLKGSQTTSGDEGLIAALFGEKAAKAGELRIPLTNMAGPDIRAKAKIFRGEHPEPE